MKRAVIAAGTMLALGAMALPSQASAAKWSATISWGFISTDGATWDYSGSIDSGNVEKCADGRKITVYREEGNKDEKIGSAIAVENIFFPSTPPPWQILDSPKGGNGSYYAVAKSSKKCKKAKSKIEKYPG